MERKKGKFAFNWAEELGASITVADENGIIRCMNQKAKKTFAQEDKDLIGSSLFECHPEPAKSKLKALYSAKEPNHYSIEKSLDGGGRVKKIIHQLPWYKKGTFAGYVEISIEIPFELPHFIRAAKKN